MKRLQVIVGLTNERIERNGDRLMMLAEIMKFFGMLVLMTKYSVGNKKDLWKAASATKYRLIVSFGRFISRHVYEKFCTTSKFSLVLESEKFLNSTFGWSMVNGFLYKSNDLKKNRL